MLRRPASHEIRSLNVKSVGAPSLVCEVRMLQFLQSSQAHVEGMQKECGLVRIGVRIAVRNVKRNGSVKVKL